MPRTEGANVPEITISRGGDSRTMGQCNNIFYSIWKEYSFSIMPSPMFYVILALANSPCFSLLCIIQSICILIKHHISIITDILTHSSTPPSSKENIRIIILIMITHDFTNCFGRFPSIIKWNTRAEMMSNVSLNVSHTHMSGETSMISWKICCPTNPKSLSIVAAAPR